MCPATTPRCGTLLAWRRWWDSFPRTTNPHRKRCVWWYAMSRFDLSANFLDYFVCSVFHQRICVRFCWVKGDSFKHEIRLEKVYQKGCVGYYQKGWHFERRKFLRQVHKTQKSKKYVLQRCCVCVFIFKSKREFPNRVDFFQAIFSTRWWTLLTRDDGRSMLICSTIFH